MYCLGALNAQDEDLARRVYAYFIFRLRQPEDAERLTRLSFKRIWEEANLGRPVQGDPDLAVFAAARAVIADNPRARGVARFPPSESATASTGLSTELALAIGRLHGRERDALALRFGAELSVGEIAELLDRTPADVKQRLARGVRSLVSLGALPKESRVEPSAERPGAAGPEIAENQED